MNIDVPGLIQLNRILEEPKIELLNIKEAEKVIEPEINLLKDILIQVLRLPGEFNDWQEIYKLASHRLHHTIDISGMDNIDIIMNKVGMTDLSPDFELYVINEMPNNVYKISWGNLKKAWEEIWCPPVDDALLLVLPNQRLVLLTHWDAAYYN